MPVHPGDAIDSDSRVAPVHGVGDRRGEGGRRSLRVDVQRGRSGPSTERKEHDGGHFGDVHREARVAHDPNDLELTLRSFGVQEAFSERVLIGPELSRCRLTDHSHQPALCGVLVAEPASAYHRDVDRLEKRWVHTDIFEACGVRFWAGAAIQRDHTEQAARLLRGPGRPARGPDAGKCCYHVGDVAIEPERLFWCVPLLEGVDRGQQQPVTHEHAPIRDPRKRLDRIRGSGPNKWAKRSGRTVSGKR